jgi:diguanylate cyclase (GGDEF)-like protein
MQNTPPSSASSAPRSGVWVAARRSLASSVLGRRMLGQYIGAALLPIAALAVLDYLHVSDTLQQARDTELAQAAGSYGTAMQDRLLLLENALHEVSELPSPSPALTTELASRIGKEFEGVTRLGPAGQRNDLAGSVGALPSLDPATREDLGLGQTVLRLTDGSAPRVVLLKRVTAGADSAYLAAFVNPSYLAGYPGAAPKVTNFCVMSEGQVVIGCEKSLPPTALLQLTSVALARRPDAVSWQDGNQNYRSSASILALQSRFSAPTWTVVASQSEAYALAPTRSFQIHFLEVASVAAVLMVALGAWQTRRIVDPLRRLLAGTRRIMDHDFSSQVPVSGRDEIAQLSLAFNEMARNLGMHFATLNVLSQIDKTILTKLDINEVAKCALRCVRYITSAHVVMLGLYESETAGSMRIYALRRDGHAKIRAKFALTPELKRRIPTLAASAWCEDPPLPQAILARLKEEDQVQKYWVRPVARNGRTWGVLVLGHATELTLTPDQLSLLSGVDGRLEVAFSALERDRKLNTMAHADALTGLPNRASMLALLAQELSSAQRDHTSVGILFLDLDRFKRTNDTLGHAAGDALLRQAAERIKDNLRAGDAVARPGGDEFTVLLSNLSSARDAGTVARQLIKALSRPFEVDGHTIYVGASVGIAVYPQDGMHGADLLKKADSAMYRAKDLGRNRFEYYKESMNIEAQRRAALDRELRQAFDRNELLLHFQPQIDVRTGLVCAVEALVRWQHPEQGLLLPATFIPFAEESGLIDAIGSWVLKEACLQHQRWRKEGVPIPRITVNVSNRQLLRSNFLRTVHYLLNLAKMPLGTLELEVTESMFVEGGKAGIEALNALVAAGVRVAIDDFGTGYSSFGYLKTLPAAVLKLDKSFLDDAPADNDSATIVAAMINMAHTLRKEVVAEGVEREDQYRFLEQLGCEKVQGFLFCEAVPAEQAAQFAIGRLKIAKRALSNPDLEIAESV